MTTARWFTYDGEFTGEGADLPYDEPDPLLLDLLSTYTCNQAYSLRRLKLAYAGKAVRVRRSSDNTELDIGFDADGKFLDTAALLTFAGVGNAFVSKWYDQSGNTRDLVQATTAKQPKIVATGALVTIGDGPGVQFTGSDVHLKHSSPTLRTLVAATGYSAAEVHTDDASHVAYAESDQANPGGRVTLFGWNGDTPPIFRTSVTNSAGTDQTSGAPFFNIAATGEVHSDIATKNNGAGGALYRDGVSKSSTSWNPTMPTTATSATMGGMELAVAGAISSDYIGKIGEHVLLAGVIDSSAIAVINASHADYFGI